MNNSHRYFIVHKPFNMVSQFVSPDEVELLSNLKFPFPVGTHAIGRLDNHSEGLLILTTDKRVTRLLFNSNKPHERTYYIQVNNLVTQERLQQLKEGVTITIERGEQYIAKPTKVEIIPEPVLFKRDLKESQQYIPNTWLRITLTEGKFHQIRKMIAAIHHRVRRLIRVSIEDLLLEDLPAGHVKELSKDDFFCKLKIEQ